MTSISRFILICMSLLSVSHAVEIATRLQSSLIWSAEAVPGAQAYVAFRKSFELTSVPQSVRLHGFADSRYLLWVNGRQVLRGPSRFHPNRPEFDSMEISQWLQPGSNTLVALVHHYAGVTSGRIIRHDPGLTLLLEADGQELLRTGADWKSSACTEYQPSPGAWSSIPDVIDGRKSPGDWTGNGFDDASWKPAIPVDGNLWGAMQSRSTPMSQETLLTGLRTMPTGEPLESKLPMMLKTSETRPWSYPGGFSGKWMWSPNPARRVAFKAVWSNAGFGVGSGSALKVVCDNRFTLFQNGKEIARSEDVKTGWTGVIDVADGDVLAIEAEDFEQGDHTAGLFVSMVNQGNHILGTGDFRCATDELPQDWTTSESMDGFSPLSGSNIHPAHVGEALGSDAVVIDLGRMAMVYPALDIEADDGSALQIEYALRFVDGKPAESYGIGTTYTARAGRQTVLAADQWCARYVTVRCLTGRVKLLGLQMTDRRYPYERLGKFSCDDAMLTQLWDMAVRTVEVTTDDAHGSDARERNEWVQDGSKASFNTMRVAAAAPDGRGGRVFSDPRTLRKLLTDAAVCQMPDGRLPGTFPTDRGAEDTHHFIDDYALQWVEALRWHQELTCDSKFVREMWPVLTRQMRWFLDRVTPGGLLLAREYASFDNPIAYRTCEGATINAFFYHALRDSAWLAEQISETAAAGEFSRAADALAAAFNARLWNPAEQAYSAGVLDGETLAPSLHGQVMALYSGIVPPDRLPSTRAWLMKHFRNPGAGMVIGPKKDFREHLAAKSGFGMPIMFYWGLSELYRMDTPEADALAISEIRSRWGNMVRFLQDAGTLSESFVNDQGGGMSESCHNYGSIPAYFLSAHVLGVRCDGPADQRRLIIQPRRAGLQRADGAVVTPFGVVPMSWEIRDHTWHFQFTVPDGVQAELRLPDVVLETLKILGNDAKPEIHGRNTCVRLGPGIWLGSATIR